MEKSFLTLEFDKILEMLCTLAVSQRAQERLRTLRPVLSESECARRMRETTDARRIFESFGSPPLAPMKEMEMLLELCAKGAMLLPEQLGQVAQFLAACRRMKSYLKRAELLSGDIALYGGSISPLDELCDEIERSVRGDRLDDAASATLRDLRRQIENMNNAIKAKLETLLRGHKEWFADGYVAARNGRLVLPVKREFKNMVSGSVVDTSSTGSTYFIEPSSVRKLQEELSQLEIEEDNEVRRILYTLTALVDENAAALHINIEAMESLDFVFAKAKLSVQMNAIPVPVTGERRVVLKGARHPLLKKDSCVPIDFEIGGAVSGVVITGPNTGGKTVALKTVGLLSVMAQCGLHLPVEEGSTLCLHNLVLCDIGDGQSIAENLSTFSAHITNIIEILRLAGSDSLVLLDELGSGTDPAEGMGIAVAVLTELRTKGCLFVVTTHYPEIKEYAQTTEGLVNARMAFDRESLRPLYRLELGEAGESCALYIAQRFGFPEHLLKTAHEAAYGGGVKKSASESTANDFISSISTPVSAVKGAAVTPRIEREKPKSAEPSRAASFRLGDSVMVYPQKEIGIVYQAANERGEVGVQLKNREKKLIPHKRLKLQVPAAELYPPDYDFSVIFDSVANRKARHVMGKRHDPNMVIVHE